MLSMSKLLMILLLLSSSLFASDSSQRVVEFLKKSFKHNPNIVSMEINIAQEIPVEKMKGWNAYIVDVDAVVKAKEKNRNIAQKMIWFSNGTLITQDFVDMKTGKSLKELATPTMKPEHYSKKNLIYGNPDAKHKIAIFSDPLCPFCRTIVPQIIKDVKDKPDTYALYYYHLPLPSLHPSAVELTKAAIVAEHKGYKDVVAKLYTVKVKSDERDVKKILAAFNKAVGTDIKEAEIKTKEVEQEYKREIQIATDLMVQGTPTVFFNGKVDKSKIQYKKVN